MWRHWLKKLRLRLGTLILLVIILGMAIALVRQRQREVRLQSALRYARSLNDEAIRVALDGPFTAGPLASNPRRKPSLEQLLIQIKRQTNGGVLWSGLPIYVDPIGLQEVGATISSPVKVSSKKMTIKEALEESLGQLNLDFVIRDGLIRISSTEATDKSLEDEP